MNEPILEISTVLSRLQYTTTSEDILLAWAVWGYYPSNCSCVYYILCIVLDGLLDYLNIIDIFDK